MCSALFDPTWVAVVRAGERAKELDLRLANLKSYELAARRVIRNNSSRELHLVASLWALERANIDPGELAEVALLTIGAEGEAAPNARKAILGGGNIILALQDTGYLTAYAADVLRLAHDAGALTQLLTTLLEEGSQKDEA